MFGKLPLRRVLESTSNPLPREEWPATLAPVRELLRHGLDLGRATVFVGENGAGKSTLVEGIAMAYGLNPEGGSTGAMHRSRSTESPLGESLSFHRNPGTSKYGYFLRAETMHGFFSYLQDNRGPHDPNFHAMSHGESFLELSLEKFRGGGLWVLDEPESALSFQGCLALLSHLKFLMDDGGSQVILSTHSPLLASLPGATIYEVGDWGLREEKWADLELVRSWKMFLDAPTRYLRHL